MPGQNIGPPVVPLYQLFWGQASPTKLDYGKKSWYPSNLSTGGPSPILVCLTKRNGIGVCAWEIQNPMEDLALPLRTTPCPLPRAGSSSFAGTTSGRTGPPQASNVRWLWLGTEGPALVSVYLRLRRHLCCVFLSSFFLGGGG